MVIWNLTLWFWWAWIAAPMMGMVTFWAGFALWVVVVIKSPLRQVAL